MAALLAPQHAEKLKCREIGWLLVQYLGVDLCRLIEPALSVQIERVLDRRRSHHSALQSEGINMSVMRDQKHLAQRDGRLAEMHPAAEKLAA